MNYISYSPHGFQRIARYVFFIQNDWKTNSHSKIIKINFNSFYWLRTVTVSINSYQNKSSFIALLNKVQTTKTTGVRSNKFRSTDIYKYNSTELFDIKPKNFKLSNDYISVFPLPNDVKKSKYVYPLFSPRGSFVSVNSINPLNKLLIAFEFFQTYPWEHLTKLNPMLHYGYRVINKFTTKFSFKPHFGMGMTICNTDRCFFW